MIKNRNKHNFVFTLMWMTYIKIVLYFQIGIEIQIKLMDLGLQNFIK